MLDSQRALEIATSIARHHGEPNPGSIDAVTSTYECARHPVFGSSDHAHAAGMPVLIIQRRDGIARRFPVAHGRWTVRRVAPAARQRRRPATVRAADLGFCAPSGTRTPNPLIKSQLLCQLS